jgi:hypothetical protein
MKTQAHTLRYERIQYGLAVLVVSLCVSYAYLLCSSVAFAASQKELSYQSAHTVEALSALESDYFTKTSGFTEDKAKDLGLVAISEKSYVSESQTLGFARGTLNEN